MLVSEPIDLQLAAPCLESPWLRELVSGPEVAEMALSATNTFFSGFAIFSVFSNYFLGTTNLLLTMNIFFLR